MPNIFRKSYVVTFHGLGANICDCIDLKHRQAKDGNGRCVLENGRFTTTIFKMVEDVQGIYMKWRLKTSNLIFFPEFST